MQSDSQPATGGRQGCHEIDDCGIRLLKQAWFNSAGCFNRETHADLLAPKNEHNIRYLTNFMVRFADLVADMRFVNIPLI